MKQAFLVKNFSAKSINLIKLINDILAEYAKQHFTLTLRQLYYQLVARGYIENSTKSYSNIGNLVSDGRQAGFIDWSMIEDRGRETVKNQHWENPAQIVEAAARSFRINKWKDQPYHIELMVEKDALSGVLLPVARDLDIALTANKGYSSSSTMYDIGKRLYSYSLMGKSLCVIYLGDHDPSGIDMTRDVDDRLSMYASLRKGETDVVRVALNFDQVILWNPPENPAKTTDSRYGAYRAKYGDSSWELDAVEPRNMASLIRDIVLERRDESLWHQAVVKEQRMRDHLQNFADTYESDQADD